MKQTVEEAAHSFAESRSSGSLFPAYYQGFIAGADWNSLRREYACRAMQGILRVYCTVNDPERYALVAKDAVKYADALIDELRK